MEKSFFKRDTCRLCGSKNLQKVLPLTPTALCDAYVTADRVDKEQEIYPLDLFMCLDCGYVHVPYVVDPKLIYLDYLYVTTSSLGLSDHFHAYANEVMRRLKPQKGTLAVDIGSNDGTLLGFFKGYGMRVLGIEPAAEIAKDATRKGIDTLPEFFSIKLAREIKKKYGPAAVVTINNLFANIDDLKDMTEGIRTLLAPDGILIIESSYLADLIENMVFDFIYHEHLSYFSVRPLISFFKGFDMELIDLEHMPAKGGLLRYYFQPSGGPRPVAPSVAKIVSYEEKSGLDRSETFKAFSEKINSRKSLLVNKLLELKNQGKTIAAYGASATSTTLIYHFDLGKRIDYIVDDNPAKQNTFSPGYHIPVLPSKVIYERNPDYLLILAWRYAESIINKNKEFLKQGGRFIVPLPKLKII